MSRVQVAIEEMEQAIKKCVEEARCEAATRVIFSAFFVHCSDPTKNPDAALNAFNALYRLGVSLDTLENFQNKVQSIQQACRPETRSYLN